MIQSNMKMFVTSAKDKPVDYFTMPERVFRQGKWISIKDNNQSVFNRKRKGATSN